MAAFTFGGVDHAAAASSETPLPATEPAPALELSEAQKAWKKMGDLEAGQRQQHESHQNAMTKMMKTLEDMQTKMLLLLTQPTRHSIHSDDGQPEGGKGVDPLDVADKAGVGGFNYANAPKAPERQVWNNPERSDYNNHRNQRLEEKSYRRVDKFQAGETEWQEFAFDVTVTTRALNPELASKMEEITKKKELDPDYFDKLYDQDKELSRGSKELFEVLCQLTGGQAKSLLRGVDRSDGLKAWRVLHTTYARDTLARTLRLYREVINPSQCASVDQIITSIGKWETRLKELERHSCSAGEVTKLPEMVKLAALTEICTNDIRDLVYQNADSGRTYEEIREKIIGWTSNRIAASAAHMDIGHVDSGECQMCDHDFTGGYMEVNMAGKCYNCGVVGHPARLCPAKGKGKGGNGGKGGPKGGGKSGGMFYSAGQPFNPKGFGKGGASFSNPATGTKGGGKGYQGSCWTCGMVGHKSAECRSRRTNLVEAEEEEVDVGTKEIGGVWLMGHVGKVIETSNRFKALSKDDEEVEQADWEVVADKRQQKAFTGKAKMNLTTRNTTGSITKKVDSPMKKAQNARKDERVTAERLIANIGKAGERLNSAVCQMTFHLTDASKFLASVNRMTEAGNEVNFNRRESFIKSPNGQKATLRKRGGVYVLDVVFLDGDRAVQGEVIVDSGAADNVMPNGMLGGVITREREHGVNFVAADGGRLGNYGRKDIQFIPLEFWEGEFGSPFQGQA
jgi:hypothetical protein